MAAEAGERSARRRAKPTWMLTQEAESALDAEVESALVAHANVAEAAVVGFPHDIKGQGIYAYVTLNANVSESDDIRKALIQWVRKEIKEFNLLKLY